MSKSDPSLFTWYADLNQVKSRPGHTVCTVSPHSFDNPEIAAQLIAELPEIVKQLTVIQELLEQFNSIGLPVESDLDALRSCLERVNSLIDQAIVKTK